MPSMDAIVDTYDQTTPTSSCEWTRVRAVRLALVARNEQYEKDAVTTTALTWAASNDLPIDLTSNGDWQHYRYKVFQTVVPLRNVVAAGVTSGC